MRTVGILGLTLTLFAASACTNGTPSAPSTAGGDVLSAMSGTWRSTATAVAGICTVTNYTVTPTGANTATISYSATCAGVPVSGTGSGTMNGTTFNWTTSGFATSSCSLSLNGTAVPSGTSDLTVAYGGVVCGVPVSGSEILHR